MLTPIQVEYNLQSAEYYFATLMDQVVDQTMQLEPVDPAFASKVDELFYTIEAVRFFVDRGIFTENAECLAVYNLMMTQIGIFTTLPDLSVDTSLVVPGTDFIIPYQGPQGPEGPQGPVGPQGFQGSNGQTGSQGPQGPIGFQGQTGPQGVSGPQGLIGSQGFQGPLGPQGPQGVNGTSVVLKGSVQSVINLPSSGNTQGDLYIVLDDGDGYVWDGTQWENAGPIVGPQGPQGPQGVNGIQGSTGPQGVTGPQGTQGNTGPQGFQGFQGPQGQLGPQGSQGPQGLQGPQGFQGTQGNQGFQGPQGSTADLSNYVTLSTDQSVTGAKTFTTSSRTTFHNSDFAQIRLRQSSSTANYLEFGYSTNANFFSTSGFDLRTGFPNSQVDALYITPIGNVGLGTNGPSQRLHVVGSGLFSNNVTASSFIRSGGTSSQFLKADGSIDSTSYVPLSSLSDYVTLATQQSISGAKTFTTQAGTIFQNNDATQVSFRNTSDLTKTLNIGQGSNSNIISSTGLDFRVGGLSSSALLISANENATFKENLTAKSFIRSGGTSGQFLKADGSVDSNSYLTLTGGNINGSVAITNSGLSIPFTVSSSSGIVASITGTATGGGGVLTVQAAGGTAGLIFNNSSTNHTLDVLANGTSPIARFRNSSSNVASIDNNGSITGFSFIKTGGTSSQFLKADGSVDSVSYLPRTGGSLTGALSGTSASFSVSGTTPGLDVRTYGTGGMGAYIEANNTSIGLQVNSSDSNAGLFTNQSSTFPTMRVLNLSSASLLVFANSGGTVASVANNGNITSTAFIKSGGTSNQYLMADGSVSTLENGTVFGINDKFTVNLSSGQLRNVYASTSGNSYSTTLADGWLARAWVQFIGDVNPPSILASGNVSSITDNGTGNYSVNFATALPDTAYSVSYTNMVYGRTDCIPQTFQSAPFGRQDTTNFCRISSRNAAGAAFDSQVNSVVVFR